MSSADHVSASRLMGGSSELHGGFDEFLRLAGSGLREDSTTIEQEMIMRSLGLGYRVVEVPSHEYERKAGVSRIKVRRAALTYVICMCRDLWWTRYPKVAPLAEPAHGEHQVPVNR